MSQVLRGGDVPKLIDNVAFIFEEINGYSERWSLQVLSAYRHISHTMCEYRLACSVCRGSPMTASVRLPARPRSAPSLPWTISVRRWSVLKTALRERRRRQPEPEPKPPLNLPDFGKKP